jgi:hypothetical protein
VVEATRKRRVEEEEIEEKLMTESEKEKDEFCERDVEDMEVLLDGGQGEMWSIHDRARQKKRRIERGQLHFAMAMQELEILWPERGHSERERENIGGGSGRCQSEAHPSEGNTSDVKCHGEANCEQAQCHSEANPSERKQISEANCHSEAKRVRLFVRDDDTVSTASETEDEESLLGEADEGNDHSEIIWDANPPLHWDLDPPRLEAGGRVDGSNKRQLRRENKARRIAAQELQQESSFWTTHAGEFVAPEKKIALEKWRGSMCPSNLALDHPAAEKLLEYATGGCPANTGKPWTKEQMWAAVEIECASSIQKTEMRPREARRRNTGAHGDVGVSALGEINSWMVMCSASSAEKEDRSSASIITSSPLCSST